MMQQDWHSADIIAALKKQGHITFCGFPSSGAGILHTGKCAYSPLA